MTTLDQIKSLMKSGDIAGAEALCKKALETHPDDAWLKRRYGMCRRLQGDEETFRRINDEISEMEKKKKKKEALFEMYVKLGFALVVVALAIGGAVAFKYVMTGVLVLAAILEMAMYLLFRNQSSVHREYVMIGVFLAAAMATIVVYFGHRFFNGINCGAHACDPVPDVVVVGEPAGTNIVKPASTNNVVPTVGTLEQLAQTGSKTP